MALWRIIETNAENPVSLQQAKRILHCASGGFPPTGAVMPEQVTKLNSDVFRLNGMCPLFYHRPSPHIPQPGSESMDTKIPISFRLEQAMIGLTVKRVITRGGKFCRTLKRSFLFLYLQEIE